MGKLNIDVAASICVHTAERLFPEDWPKNFELNSETLMKMKKSSDGNDAGSSTLLGVPVVVNDGLPPDQIALCMVNDGVISICVIAKNIDVE